jgi:thiol-disulfide isomerase/thioredoxin
MAAASPMQPASHFFARGYALHACRHTNGIDLSGMNARPIPFKFSESGDPWALPVSIEPKPCGSAQRPGLPPVGSGKGKPFIGVALSGNVVQQVTSQSPAAGAGLQAGDQIVSFQGEPVSDPAQLGIILARLAPGDSVELEVKRGSETMKKKLTLADRYEAVESKQDRIGKPVADLVATDVHGREVRLSSFRGKVILLDFWATWCKPCREAMPALQLLSETLESRDFVWIGVSVDDDQDAWTSYVRDNRLGGIQLRSPEWANTMFVNSYPTILLVDRAGVIQCDSAGESVAQTVMAMLSEK